MNFGKRKNEERKILFKSRGEKGLERRRFES